MIDRIHKKYHDEMRFTRPIGLNHRTIEELRHEVSLLEHTVNYWHDKFEHRAFGEIKDGNLSYEEWRDIYTRNGWVEVSDFRSCYNPKGVTSSDDWASYELDKAYLTIWKAWHRYHQLWRFRLNKLEVTRFDMRRVTHSPYTTIEEALFVCLGLSPSVIGSVGFDKFSLSERRFEIKDIEYQDYLGNNCIINTDLYSNDSYGHIEWYLRHKEEHTLVERVATRGQPSNFTDSIRSEKFLKWAFKHNYIEEIIIKIRHTKDSPFGEEFALKLHTELLNVGVISGAFVYMWEWHCPWASLHYLANQLVECGLVEVKQQHKSIIKYIDYTSTRDLRKQYSENTNKDDPDEAKLYQDENKLIDKALTTLELERDNKLKS